MEAQIAANPQAIKNNASEEMFSKL